jgi:hypothetical protein
MQDRSTDRFPVPPPMCPDCLKPMQYRMSVPHEKYSMLLHVMFVCDYCGRVCELLVAKSMLTIRRCRFFDLRRTRAHCA